MNAMLLLVAILTALIAVLGYNLVTLNQAFNISATIQQNQSRVMVVTSSIRTGLTVIDGKVAVPISQSLTASVPEIAPFRTSANGTPYVYCPILPSVASGTSNIRNDQASETYAVDTVDRNGLTYAVAGRPGSVDDQKLVDLGIVAYVLTPQPNNANPLRCADVKVADDGTTVLVPGGSVAAIYDNPVNADGASFVFSQGGSRPAHALTSDRLVRGVADVVDYVRHYDVSDVRLRFVGGETVDGNDLAALLASSHGRTVRLQGPDDVRASVLITDEDADGELLELIAAGRAVFSNIALKGVGGADVAIVGAPGGSVILDNTQIGRVRTNGGSILLSGTSRIVPASSAIALANPVLADGGEFVVDVSDSPSAPALVSQSSSSVFSSFGGDVVIKSRVHAVAGVGAILFSRARGGEFSFVSPAAEVLVDRGNGFNAEQHSDLQRVSASCADGDPSCTASCPAETRVAWGECGSANAAALAGFSVDATGSQYTCEWAQMTIAVAPKAAVVCQPR